MKASEILNELDPYKRNVIYKMATDVFSAGDQPNDNKMAVRGTRDQALTTFSKYLKDHGFNSLGKGSFASVYEKPGYPWIIKVFTYDDPYRIFLDYVSKNQNNPNLPKLKGLYLKINDHTYCTRMEKLTKMRTSHELVDFFDKFVGRNPGSKLPPKARAWLEQKYPGILQILNDVQPILKGKGYILDLHDANMMLRGNVPVITDPFANMNYV